jgi:predicted aspartyl protease
MDIVSAWGRESTTGTFRIPVKIINPNSNTIIVKYCLFDTGFSGYLGLDKETIKDLGLKQIGIGKALTANGLLDYSTFLGKAELIDQKNDSIGGITSILEDKIEKKNIPVQEFEINIIGIKAIVQFNWLILGDKDILCILK